MNRPIPTTDFVPASPRFVRQEPALAAIGAASAAEELSAGLLAHPAQVSPKFFYDEQGSSLFEAITRLDEYYPTRTEAAIFEQLAPQLPAVLARHGIGNASLIDLGAGNCAKAAALIPHLQPRQYVPVDISVDFLQAAAGQLQTRFPALDIVGVGMDFSAGLALPEAVQRSERVFFYPGSSLGNFNPQQALGFLQQLADPRQANAAGLLLGIDLVKDAAILEAAYDDALGVTAAFNKNMLRHINRLLGANFDLRQWRHLAQFNAALSRIEMHLEALCPVTVAWPGGSRNFVQGERIHTENSYKYTPESMSALLRQAGFAQVQHWTDAKGWFAVFWAAV